MQLHAVDLDPCRRGRLPLIHPFKLPPPGVKDWSARR
jgi:hypothetical protein